MSSGGGTVDGSAAVESVAPVEPVEPEPRYVGAATAVEGSTRAPVPQGMGLLGSVEPGWSAFSGAVVLPSAAAIVKRVVQRMVLGAAGVEN